MSLDQGEGWAGKEAADRVDSRKVQLVEVKSGRLYLGHGTDWAYSEGSDMGVRESAKRKMT